MRAGKSPTIALLHEGRYPDGGSKMSVATWARVISMPVLKIHRQCQ